MFQNKSSFKPLVMVYRTPLYKNNVDAALKSGYFKSRRSFANMLSLVSRSQIVEWENKSLSGAFAWGLTIVPWTVWDAVVHCKSGG